MTNETWLVGASQMAVDYHKVCDALKIPLKVVGRGMESAANFEKATGTKPSVGGLEQFLASRPPVPSHAIVAVGTADLPETTAQLLRYGVKRILVEKPGALFLEPLKQLKTLQDGCNGQVFIGYNRRYFASVEKAREIILEDGGLTSCFFEFTEWASDIEALKTPDAIKQRWLLANSTHVIDLAFHLAGEPESLASFHAGSFTWHSTATQFVGAGVSKRGTLLSYHANWDAPGRWGMELLTAKRRLFLRPMEKLSVQVKQSVQVNEVALDNATDVSFKPGLYKQTQTFFGKTSGHLCTLEEQIALMRWYLEIGRYKG